MKDILYDQRTVAFSQNCCKRMIEAMNVSRKDKTVKENIRKKKKYHLSKQIRVRELKKR